MYCNKEIEKELRYGTSVTLYQDHNRRIVPEDGGGSGFVVDKSLAVRTNGWMDDGLCGTSTFYGTVTSAGSWVSLVTRQRE